MNIHPYLQRINYKNEITPDLNTLFQLQQAHLYHIPFEDLNIHFDIPIVLTIRDLYQKVILDNRGGFCYELNGLFNELLKKLGFKTTIISAKVLNKAGVIGPPYDHLALIVDLEKRWLVDVGFGGDSFIFPKELKLGIIQKDVHDTYKFIKHNEQEWFLMHSKDGVNFKGQYVFSFEAQQLENFKAECHRKQTEKDSHFMQNLICTLANPSGRISILNDQLTIKHYGKYEFSKIENNPHLLKILTERFGIPTHDFKRT